MARTSGPCDLDWHGERLALAVACPGQDLIRVWPLPVEQPWWEDDVQADPDVYTASRVPATLLGTWTAESSCSPVWGATSACDRGVS